MVKCILLLLCAVVSAAQTAAQSRNSFTNHDILVLAKAGFSEEFILDAMAGARTHFDLAVDDLAALAREGISEPIIRAMLKPLILASAKPVESPPEPVAQPASAKVASCKECKTKAPPKEPKPTPVELAMASHTPYYESSSSLFGLSKKQIGVGSVTAEDHQVEAQLGAIYRQVRANHL
jgi:hypothetical protein